IAQGWAAELLQRAQVVLRRCTEAATLVRLAIGAGLTTLLSSWRRARQGSGWGTRWPGRRTAAAFEPSPLTASAASGSPQFRGGENALSRPLGSSPAANLA